MKEYQIHCPASDCAGGDGSRLKDVTGKPDWLPPEIFQTKKETEEIYRCNYCGLVWFQESSKQKGFDGRPIGFYNDFISSGKFRPVGKDYRIRQENTSYYWAAKSEKRLRRKKKYL